MEGPFTGPVAQVGLEQLHFAQLAVKLDNEANGTDVTLAQDDTQLTPSLATQKTQSIISSNAVAAVGPAGSQEVEAVGPLFGRAGMAFISGSATLPALTTDGKNPTFLRVVPNDNIQGPQDANYVVNHLHPKAVLIIDDDEAYSQGLVKTMIPIFQKAGVKVNHQTINGTDTGATLANAINSLVTSQLNPAETVTMLPWQAAANAQQFGLAAQQQHKKTILFGTDGTNSPSQFKIPGSYVSNFGPDISSSNSALDKKLVSGVAQFGPYGAFGVPSYEAADVEMKAIASVCKSGGTPSRSNVLAAIKKTNIAPSANPLGATIAFKSNGDLVGQPGYLFKISSSGKYQTIPNK
ncbi:MAG TPA: branched-chain amino acid ABC transporter substrate-binding protein [Solirubrobacteraceae bacterium]|nr:branched-chain amino acid ABC transporter substrate-binding protein [Solirubrobacteraceae bacterium]